MATCRRVGTNEQITEYGGGAVDYDEGELSNWEADTDTDHVTDTESDVLEVYKEGGGGGLWDDFIDSLDGSTNDADYFRIIRAASGEGHSGIPKDDGSCAGFRFISGGGEYVLRIQETYSQFQDLVVKGVHNVAGLYFCIQLDSANDAKVIGCLCFDSSNSVGNSGGIQSSSPGNTYVIECLVHNCGKFGLRFSSTATIYLYNCTENTHTEGLEVGVDATVNSKNCVLDSPIDNKGTHNQTTNTVNTPTYIDAPNDDFHLDPTDVVAIDNGTDLSADGNFAFDDDINDGVMGAGKAGETRSGSWDIGFDEAEAEGEERDILGALAMAGALNRKFRPPRAIGGEI